MDVKDTRQVLGKLAGSYSRAVAVPAGRLVFISGQIPVDEDGRVVGGTWPPRLATFFAKIRALVEESGGSMTNIVKITALLTDMRHVSQYAEVREEIFSPNLPASSSVEVSGLVQPGLLVEVEAIGSAERPLRRLCLT